MDGDELSCSWGNWKTYSTTVFLSILNKGAIKIYGMKGTVGSQDYSEMSLMLLASEFSTLVQYFSSEILDIFLVGGFSANLAPTMIASW